MQTVDTDNDPTLLSFQLALSFGDLYVNNLVPSSWHFGKIVQTLRFGALWKDSALGGDGNQVFSSLSFPLDMRTAPHAVTIAGQTVGSVCYRMKPFLCINHCLRSLIESCETYCSHEECQRWKCHFQSLASSNLSSAASTADTSASQQHL